MPLLNLDNRAIETMWQPNPDYERLVSLEEQFPQPLWHAPLQCPLPPEQLRAHQAAHINPLLMPDIKAAADAVRVMMNGPGLGRTR